jgi:RNA polymerase sigma-70 factor (ECF subfamily)
MRKVHRTSDAALFPAAAAAGAFGPYQPTVFASDVTTLYRQHGASVGRWAARFLGPNANAADVDDVIQDVFLVAHRRICEFRGDAKVTTWLYQITLRVIKRHRKRWRWLSLLSDTEAAACPMDEVFVSDVSAPSPQRVVEARQRTELLYRMLDQIGEKYRTALILFEWEGMPVEEIARVTQTTPANVAVRLTRARAHLLERFLKWEAKN